VFDETGVPQKDAVHDVYKHKLTSEGYLLGMPSKHEIGDTVLSEKQV